MHRPKHHTRAHEVVERLECPTDCCTTTWHDARLVELLSSSLMSVTTKVQATNRILRKQPGTPCLFFLE